MTDEEAALREQIAHEMIDKLSRDTRLRMQGDVVHVVLLMSIIADELLKAENEELDRIRCCIN